MNQISAPANNTTPVNSLIRRERAVSATAFFKPPLRPAARAAGGRPVCETYAAAQGGSSPSTDPDPSAPPEALVRSRAPGAPAPREASRPAGGPPPVHG